MTRGPLEAPHPLFELSSYAVPMANTPEGRLTALVKRRVTAAGGVTWKNEGGGGVPDRTVVDRSGRIHIVELKAEGGRLEDDQRIFHRRLRELTGVEAITLTGHDEVVGWLKSVGLWTPLVVEPKTVMGRPQLRR